MFVELAMLVLAIAPAMPKLALLTMPNTFCVALRGLQVDPHDK